METQWKIEQTGIFWKDIVPTEHVIQLYDNEASFIQTLGGFVEDGCNAQEPCLIIAMAEHLYDLEACLVSRGHNIDELLASNKYFPFVAEDILAGFMVNGWPDEDLFFKKINALLAPFRNNNIKVRVFGEMVAILWAQGNYPATIQLEQLWNKFCKNENLCLFCAYPKDIFSVAHANALQHICGAHTKIIVGNNPQDDQIYYMNTAS